MNLEVVFKKNTQTIIFNIFIFSVFSFSGMANSSTSGWTVPENDRLVLRWTQAELKPETSTQEQSLRDIRKHFNFAGLPGQSWRYDHIYSLMKNINLKDASKHSAEQDEITYYRARLMQHSHNFHGAELLLNTIQEGSRYFSAAKLLLAQVLFEQERYNDAKSACLNLVLVQADIAAGCTAATMKEISEPLQGVLANLIQRSNDELIQSWFLYQSVRGYLGNNEPQKALDLYLSGRAESNSNSAELTVADLALVAEAYLRLQRPQAVIDLLSDRIVKRYPDDALILQLARAEKQLDQGGGDRSWRSYATVRMEERVRRNDVSYGELISIYYLELKNNIELSEVWKKKYQQKINDEEEFSSTTTLNSNSERFFLADFLMTTQGDDK